MLPIHTTLSAEFLADRSMLEEKYHFLSQPFNAFARMAYHGWEADPGTGYNDEEMAQALKENIASLSDTEHAVLKAKQFAFVLDHMRFGISEHDYFVLLWNWNRPANATTVWKWSGEVPSSEEHRRFRSSYSASGDVAIWMDYDHSVPDWPALYTLGFVGIRDRARAQRAEHEAKRALNTEESAYFDAIEIEYNAILRLIARMRDYAGNCTFPKAKAIAGCLDTLSSGAPKTLYERLMLIYLYFMLSESVDSYQVRSLGSGLDHDLEIVYRNDLGNGIPAETLDSYIAYFLMQFSAIGNYWGQPFYLGGTNTDGTTRVSDMTYKILSVYDILGIYNPKIQIKYGKSSPSEYLETVCDMIRRGHSSFVFVCEDNIVKHMADRGIPYDRAYDFDVKGCYEFAVRAGEFSTAPFYVNLLGPVPRALAKCTDNDSYETVENTYFEELRYILKMGIEDCNEMETQLARVNPSPMLSATITRSLETACDAYYDGAEYNTSAMVIGAIGSAVDALMAVKQLVYVQKAVSLSTLKRVLDENWSDPSLRARALALPQKYGCGNPEADTLAARIADTIASFQGTPNSRGGIWKITVHSARQYIELGKKMKATPDGRLAGEETSKNASPTQGMDRQGVTALIRSALATKPDRFTEGYGFDVMLHETAVRGEDGLQAMCALLNAYAAGGGSTMQFNVFNAETLREAQTNPAKYRNLQIRVCGWNVLFSNMCREEQDAYIRRAEAIL